MATGATGARSSDHVPIEFLFPKFSWGYFQEMIKEACQLKPKIITEHIEIRAEYCGKIIGKGGENLKDIREHSGTRILISKEPVNGNQDIRLCSIEGKLLFILLFL